MANENNTSTGPPKAGSSSRGIIVGLILIAIGAILLYWNEGRTAKNTDALTEAQQIAVAMTDISKVDSNFNGKFVNASGMVETQEELTDSIFGVHTKAIALIRKVEYYQWKESQKSEIQKKSEGTETTTTYVYEKVWSDKPIVSGKFKQFAGHVNSTRLVVSNEKTYAKDVRLGAYRLPDYFIRQISSERPFTVSISEKSKNDLLNQIRTLAQGTTSLTLSGSYGNYGPLGGFNAFSQQRLLHVQGSTIYIGPNPNAPTVGDVRITFSEIPTANVSILAKVNGDTFEEYVASNGNTVSSLQMGIQSTEKMIHTKKEGNKTMAWIFRLLIAAGIIVILFYLKGKLKKSVPNNLKN